MAEPSDNAPAYLVLDTESVPDGQLLARVKYSDQNHAPEEAIRLAQEEALQKSSGSSDFLPVTFQYPIAVCVARVNAAFELTKITCLDAPQFRPRQIAAEFWRGVATLPKATLVTFNGRGFDLPLLELAAFRFGCNIRDHLLRGRDRYRGNHLDLMEWMTNFNAYRMVGGLNLLSKLLGKPGKMQLAGDLVYQQFREGKLQAINDYCLCDTLDTYFVFLRTRVLLGEISLEQEQELVQRTKVWLQEKAGEIPALDQYLANWGDWTPWP